MYGHKAHVLAKITVKITGHGTGGQTSTIITRVCATVGLRMKFKTLFMSDEKHGHHFDLPLLFNMSNQCLAPAGGLSLVLSVFKLLSCKPGASGEALNVLN